MGRERLGFDMSVRVELGERTYEVHVGAGLVARLGEVARAAIGEVGRRAFIVADSGVTATFVESAAGSLAGAGFNVTRVTIEGGERCKTLGHAERLLQELAATRHERSDLIVAIGGGAVCDLAGFVAAIYRRGVPVVHCPTTLLSMVDATVGGKTGVNLIVNGHLKKNMVGAFWQPAAVVADADTLRSLPIREFRAGLGECLKHGLIGAHAGDALLFDDTLVALKNLYNRPPDLLTDLIQRNVRVKAAIVARDEREEASDDGGGRALLNLGHTFGHVIESNSPLLHGECVALGLVAAAAVSGHLNLAPAEFLHNIRSSVKAAFVAPQPGKQARKGIETVPNAADPTIIAPLSLPPIAALIDQMHEDKKSRGGEPRIVVPLRDRRARVIRNPDPAALAAGWRAIGAE
jgi:3-dehydroquinate synthase